MKRRSLLLALATLPIAAWAGKVVYPQVTPGRPFAAPATDGDSMEAPLAAAPAHPAETNDEPMPLATRLREGGTAE